MKLVAGVFRILLWGAWIAEILSQNACEISTSDQNSLYEIGEDLAVNDPVFRLGIQPPNAAVDLQPIIVGPLNSRYRWRFTFQQESQGILRLIANDSLTLPNYPSSSVSASLQFKVLCNNQEYAAAYVTVKNRNTHAPRFYRTPYSINISEATRPGTSFDLPILVIDWDPASYYTITLTIQSGNLNNTFDLIESGNIQDVSSLPGELSDLRDLYDTARPSQLPKLWKLILNRPIDFEYGTRTYHLFILASDNGGSDGLEPKTATTPLVVNIADHDDRPPVFLSGSYHGNISLSAPSGTEVIFDPKIEAVDGDPAINAQITYSFVPDRWTDYFTLNHTTGAIFLTKKLPQDIAQTTFALVMRATEVGTSSGISRTANAYIYIHIVYSGKNAPVFVQCAYETSIQENTVPGAQVLQLAATDPDKGDYGKFFFRLLNSSDAQAFQVDETTGVISVKSPELMDRERQESFRFQAGLTPLLDSERVKRQSTENPVDEDSCSEATVLVNLIDENDNSPLFGNDTYRIRIQDTIGHVDARDRDDGLNGVTSYGQIEQDPRDFEESVRFRGVPNVNGSLMIVIEFDAVKRPKFMPDYQLSVEAKDSGNPPRSSRARIIVSVVFSNSHLPIFEQAEYRASVLENTPEGTQIVQVTANDPDEGDSGRFLYALKDDNGGAFRIDPDSGWIYVANTSLLDGEARQHQPFTFKVTTEPLVPLANGTDVSSIGATEASVVVDLEDENDNPPVFVGDDLSNVTNEYHFFITSDWNDYIGMVKAEDADSGDFGIVSLNPVSVPRFFSLGSDGSIDIKEPLPENPEQVYTLVVEAYDSPNDPDKRKRTVATIKIFVEQTSRPLPRFLNLANTIPISEAMAVKSVAYSVLLAGGNTDDLQWDILQGNTNDTFGMRNNVVYVQRRLDAEMVQEYNLEIRASDGEQEAKSNLKIDVQDSNDNPPVFSESLYSFDMSGKNVNPGALVGSVSATDGDLTEPNNLMTYKLDAASSEYLEIDGSSGEIRVIAPLPSALQQYGFSVSAVDKGEPSLQGVAFVNLQLASSSSRPKFTQIQYAIEVLENVEPKPILSVLATHPQLKPVYNLSQNAFPDIFAINPTDGTIRTLKPLDYESKTEYNLTASACISVNGSDGVTFCDLSVVIVQVEDANDHSPVFTQSVYYVQIPNDTQIGTDVVRVNATDKDAGANADVSYAIITPTGLFRQACFSMDYDTGIIETAASLVNIVHNLTVEAFDHGRPTRKSRAQVVINVNGSNPSAPQFEHFTYRASVLENVTVGSKILTLRAYDPDPGPEGIVEYRFSNDSLTNSQSGNFSLNSTSGELFTKGSSVNYVIFRNIIYPSFRRKRREKYPVFEELSYPLTLMRNATLPKTLHRFTADVQSGSVEYEFLEVQPPIPGLKLDKNSGNLTAEAELLNHVTMNTPLFLVVRAVNSEDPLFFSDVVVRLTVRDDSIAKIPLVFPSALFRGTLKENIPSGTQLNLTVEVVEPEHFQSTLRYWLEPNDTFSIDNRGNIFTNKDIDLEAMAPESGGIYFLNVFAGDGVVMTKSKLELKVEDVDEFSPVFTQETYSAKVREDLAPGRQIIMVTATDKDFTDRHNLKYSITGGDAADYAVAQDFGLILKSENPLFDREAADRMSLTVTAEDKAGNSADAIVNIELLDVNDNTPVYVGAPYFWNVTEGSEGVGQKISLAATDADLGQNAIVSFKIVQGNLQGLFLLENFGNNKAEVSVIQELDRESRSAMMLTIEARDKGDPSLFNITTIEIDVIDVNDNPPRFYRKTYAKDVPSTFPPEFTILTVYAVDLDYNPQLRYHIMDDQTDGLFSMDPVQGLLKFTRKPPRTSTTYSLRLNVTDGRFHDFANATVRVYLNGGSSGNGTDGKTNLPPEFRKKEYNFTVEEGDNDTRVGLVSAKDPDSPLPVLLNIEPEEYKELFEIQQTNGWISAKKPLMYSNRQKSYSFLVTATDMGDPPLTAFAQVRVYVRDINNNAPEFSSEEYSALIPPNAKPGFSVPLGIQASDEDSGLNAKIRYDLIGNDAECFSVEMHEPQLTLKCDPDFYAKKSYTLKIRATDRDGDGNSNTADLTVLVSPPLDLTTVPPITGGTTTTTSTTTKTPCLITFSNPVQEVVITEATPVGAPVFHAMSVVTVTEGCTVSYALNGTAEKYFHMDSRSGTLTLKEPLSIEQLKLEGLYNSSLPENTLSFNITVTADGEGSETFSLRIRLIERNISSGLAFEKAVYRFSLKEEEPAGTLVDVVAARNLNSSNNGSRIEYLVLFGENVFGIGNTSGRGEIVSRRVLDSDGSNPKEYSFVIQASQGNMNDYASVIVTMEDINDNPPQFSKSHYGIQIPEAPYGPGGSVIADIYASDLDSGRNALVNFSIEAAGRDIPFAIGASNGQLRVFGDIDRERTKEYFFYLVATDGGSPPMSSRVPVNVTVSDVNDNAPIFQEGTHAVSIREKGPGSQSVAVVYATDPDEGDNGKVHYVLTNFRKDFVVNAESGVIETLRSLDYSKQSKYFLQVQASDLGRPRLIAVANITVEVVELERTKPKFGKKIYHVELSGDTIPGKTFLALTAGVGPLMYSLSGYRGTLFAITKDTGRLSFARSPLSNERRLRHELTVVATNETSGDNASTTISVYIEGTGDNRAFDETLYNVAIQENNKPNALIIDLNSTYEQRNLPVKYSLVSNLSAFAVDENTGRLYAKVPLDREERSHYPIRVRAVPSSIAKRDLLSVSKDQTLVFLNVTDVNDNPPRFITPDGGPTVLKVLSGQQTGTSVGYLRAEDPDFRSEITFKMNPGKDSDKFRVVPRSGQVFAAVDFATTDKDVFEFSVSAFDTDEKHETKGSFGTVRVYKLTASNQAVLVSDLPRSEVERHLVELQKRMRQLTGWNVTITHVMDHTENGMIYFNRSDIYVHASDPKTDKPIDGDKLVKALESILPQLKTNLKELRLNKVTKPPKAAALKGPNRVAEIALIVICCLIILAALLVCCCMFKWWKRRETDKVSSEYMIDSTSSGPRPYDTDTLDRKTAASILSAQTGIFAHPPRSVVSSVGRVPMGVAYEYDEDSSGASNGSVISRPFLYYGKYHRYNAPGTMSTASS